MVNQEMGAHLLAEFRYLLQQKDTDRFYQMEKDCWIGYPCAQEALHKLFVLAHHPLKLRMPNLLIISPTNNGKSMLVEKFYRENLPTRKSDPIGTPDALLDKLPVLLTQMPTEPDLRRFYLMIYSRLEQGRYYADYSLLC